MDFEYAPDRESKRRVYRVLAPGLAVQFSGLDGIFSILDLSVGGLAVRLPNVHKLAVGSDYTATFQLRDKLIMPTAKARCLRINEDTRLAAFEFVDLSERQEAMLDKLVLALQKHLIKQAKL